MADRRPARGRHPPGAHRPAKEFADEGVGSRGGHGRGEVFVGRFDRGLGGGRVRFAVNDGGQSRLENCAYLLERK